MYTSDPEKVMEHLRGMSNNLISLTYPQAGVELEDEIGVFKKMDIEVDGYHLTLLFNKADYGEYYLETFQILGKHFTFLPFHLVVKMACHMLGGHNLSFVEFYQDNRKIYCWSVCVDRTGKPIPSPIESETKSCEFEGFAYKHMHLDQLNFY